MTTGLYAESSGAGGRRRPICPFTRTREGTVSASRQTAILRIDAMLGHHSREALAAEDVAKLLLILGVLLVVAVLPLI